MRRARTLSPAPLSSGEDIPLGDERTVAEAIPMDWHYTSLHCLLVKGGSIKTGPFGTALKASEYSLEGVPIISVGEIGDGHLRVTEHTPMAPPEVVQRLPEYRLEAGDIVFGRKGAVDRSAMVKRSQEGWFLGSDGIRLRLPAGVDPAYVAHQLRRPSVRKWLLAHAVGTTMASLNQRVLAGVSLPIAPIVEQHAISKALADVDESHHMLGALIAKKRAIKDAAMQQLLTGKIRLPGFSGQWTEVNMARDFVLKARIGWQGLTTAEYMSTGEYFLVTGTDFIDGRVNWSSCNFVAQERFEQDHNIQLAVGDVLLTKDGTIGKAGYIETLPGPATLNSGVFVIRPKGDANAARYMYYVLTSRLFDDFLSRLQAGSTITHLYQKDFVDFSFEAPPYGEQAAIVAVLADMDDEIAALERRRAKARTIKNGMMQQLLTGRKRLVEPREPVKASA